jgi:hypothetical protein
MLDPSISTVKKFQRQLNNYVPEIPHDALRGVLKSFAYSFTISVVLSGGNPIAGLTGGAMGALAATVHIVCTTALKKISINASNDPEAQHVIRLLSFSVIALNEYVNLGVNYKATFFATIPLMLWNLYHYPRHTPTMGIVVI